MTDAKTAKKTSKKASKKAPPRPKPPSIAALTKRVKSLEDEVKKLKARLANGRADDDDDDDEEGMLAEMTKDGSVKYTPIKDIAQEGDDEDLAKLVHKLHDLVMGPMTTTIRQTETRVAACEERLNDCEGFLLETFPEEEKGDDTDATPEPAGP